MPPIATKNGEPLKRRRRARSRRRAAARERQAPVEGPAPPLAWPVVHSAAAEVRRASRRPGPSDRPLLHRKAAKIWCKQRPHGVRGCRNRLIERRLNAVRECSAPQSRDVPLRIADYCLAAMLVLGMPGAAAAQNQVQGCKAKTMVSRSTSKQ